MRKMFITSTSIFMILLHIKWGSCALPDCSNAFPGQYVQDPDNCHNYYICPDGEGNSHVCPDGGCFNPVGYCADADSGYCSSHCQETDITTASTTISTPASSTPTTTSTTTITTSTTSTSTTVFPTVTTPTSATDITTQTLTTAPITSTSSTPSTSPVMCGNEIPGTMIPDPIDCRKFFLCTDEGEWHLLPCPGDSCFLEALNNCYENADYCTAFCGDEPATSTITTSTVDSTASTQESTTTSTTIFTGDSTVTSTESSTATSTEMTTTPTETPEECYDVNYFVCPRKGYYAKCNYCTPEYFYCHGYGAWAHEGVCAWPLVFNPDPSYPYCVPPFNCPYHPDMSSTTTTPNPISGCTSVNDFYCPGHGYYAKCDYCVPEYYHCNHHGGYPTQGQCSGHMMFNPDPRYPFCIDPHDCPNSY